MRYDARILHDAADHLYDRADTIVGASAFLGCLFGLIGGAVIGNIAGAWMIGAGIGVALGLAFGLVIGQRQALEIRFRAQLAMCQLQIEANTRRVDPAPSPATDEQAPRTGRRFLR